MPRIAVGGFQKVREWGWVRGEGEKGVTCNPIERVWRDELLRQEGLSRCRQEGVPWTGRGVATRPREQTTTWGCLNRSP